MAPKTKSKGYAKEPVSAAKAAAAKSTESKETSWVKSQIAKLVELRNSGPPWVEEPNCWHERQLDELLDRLNNGIAKSLPEELKEGVADYISQFDDQDVSEDTFYIDRELYAEVLAPLPEELPMAPYVREATSEEASRCVLQMKAWEDLTPGGIAKLRNLLLQHEFSAEVQEAGITRLGALLAELREGTRSGSVTEGLTPKALTPIAMEAMRRFPRDAGVQRVACSVLRGIVVMDGGVTVVADAGAFALIVSSIKENLETMEVCKTGAGALYAVVQKTGPRAPERLTLRATDALEVLSQALKKHPYDLKYACEVTLPELRG
eukprot:TRINITY_DN60875_c0_g1_i1.p1 TRINITY_DN60875_c0_g1~~TRINITY_DN60875_c0_g1_i1.p1  ORF type:complete len:321 (+),score=65.70 TRINITY_DN60875_c0_g1_i1:58-1020(+)